MPRLAKGGKWTFGWVVVGPGRELPVPLEAWREYGFRSGEQALFMPGSRTSGGFAVSAAAAAQEARVRMGGAGLKTLGRSRFGDGWVAAPPAVTVRPGQRLLTVRGSRYGLGFIAGGPIFREAQGHAELEVFG